MKQWIYAPLFIKKKTKINLSCGFMSELFSFKSTLSQIFSYFLRLFSFPSILLVRLSPFQTPTSSFSSPRWRATVLFSMLSCFIVILWEWFSPGGELFPSSWVFQHRCCGASTDPDETRPVFIRKTLLFICSISPLKLNVSYLACLSHVTFLFLKKMFSFD